MVVTDRQAGEQLTHPRPPRSPALAGVVVLALLAMIATLAPQMRARIDTETPRDTVAASQDFIAWAVSTTLKQSAAQGVTAVRLTNVDLEITVRDRDGGEQRWRALPGKPVEFLARQALTPTQGTLGAGGFHAETLMGAWNGLQARDDACEVNEAQIDAVVSWGGAVTYNAQCLRRDADGGLSADAANRISSPDRIGTANVYGIDSLASATSLLIALRQLRQLVPDGQVARIDVDPGGGDAADASAEGIGATGTDSDCQAHALWRQDEPGGGQVWIDQSRLCSATSGSMLPIQTIDTPATADELAAHLFDVNQIDVPMLVGHLQTTDLPAVQSGATQVQIAWAGRFNQVAVRVASGSGGVQQVGWYSLSGDLLAIDAS